MTERYHWPHGAPGPICTDCGCVVAVTDAHDRWHTRIGRIHQSPFPRLIPEPEVKPVRRSMHDRLGIENPDRCPSVAPICKGDEVPHRCERARGHVGDHVAHPGYGQYSHQGAETWK